MEFKDYYAILEIGRQSSAEEIRAAYRSLSKRWHPDHNPDRDVTQKMQDINEAYAILKDPEKRARYDREYDNRARARAHTDRAEEQPHEEADHEVRDEHLRQDMHEARRQAEEMVAEFLKRIKDTSREAGRGAWEATKGYLYAAVILAVVGLVVLAMANRPDAPCKADDKPFKVKVYREFPEFGFAITSPCLLMDPAEESQHEYLLNLEGVVDFDNAYKMTTYKVAVIDAPQNFKVLPKDRYEEQMLALVRASLWPAHEVVEVRYIPDDYHGFCFDASQQGKDQRGLVLLKDDFAIVLTVITNNGLDAKFYEFTKGFKTIPYKK